MHNLLESGFFLLVGMMFSNLSAKFIFSSFAQAQFAKYSYLNFIGSVIFKLSNYFKLGALNANWHSSTVIWLLHFSIVFLFYFDLSFFCHRLCVWHFANTTIGVHFFYIINSSLATVFARFTSALSSTWWLAAQRDSALLQERPPHLYCWIFQEQAFVFGLKTWCILCLNHSTFFSNT